MALPNLLTVADAARELGCTPGYVRRLLREGILQGEKPGPRLWLVRRGSLSKLQKKEAKPGPGRPRAGYSREVSRWSKPVDAS